MAERTTHEDGGREGLELEQADRPRQKQAESLRENETEQTLKDSEKRLSKINSCFLEFTPSPLENITRLTTLTGEYFQAAFAMYNRLEVDSLHTVGGWRLPTDYIIRDTAAGHICYDNIKNGGEEVYIVRDLPKSPYAQSDPLVKKHLLKTYLGKSVRFAGRYRGSLCLVFQHDYSASSADKKMLGILASAIGIEEERLLTQERAMEAQRYAAEREKYALIGKIAGKMAHDFNNILGAIMGNTELALLDCTDKATRESLELILQQSLRGRNLTKNLIAFARDQEPKQEYFSLNEKIDLVLNLLKKDLRDKQVNKEYGPGVPDLLADSGMIEHCLVNLLQNAIHATSLTESPLITIRTFSDSDNIHIEIEDNGCGIPEQWRERIFEPAFTLKGSRDSTRSYREGIKGSGYGLANVKKYIEQHHGVIEIESKTGKGAKASVKLPITEKKLSEEEKVVVLNATTSFGKYILLVEDEQAIADVQYRILADDPLGHKVDMASNARTAMDLLDRNNYDLVSLDFVLPDGVNGMEVYRHLRRKHRTLPVLFISGNLSFLESIKELKRQDPYVDHVSKPCRNKEYIDSINNLLQRSWQHNSR